MRESQEGDAAQSSIALEQIEDRFDQFYKVDRVEDIDGWRVELPFFRSDGDAIRVYFWVDHWDQYHVTDCGLTHTQLWLADVDMESEWFVSVRNALNQRYDLQDSKAAVALKADEDSLGKRIIELAQAITTLSDMVRVHRERIGL